MPEVPLPDWLSWGFWTKDPQSIRDLVITVAALVGVPFVVWREWLNYRQTKAGLQQAATAQLRHEAQVEADRERRITDNFTRAIELLASDGLEARLGAIYALERIARESQNDHWPIMETLTAYLRKRARWGKETPSASIQGRPPPDIQAALTAVGRRRKDYDPATNRLLDLSHTDLRFSQLLGADLERVMFVCAHLENAVIINTHLERASFSDARLDRAFLGGTHLKGARFGGAHLEGTDLENTDLTQEQFDSAITDENTRVPAHIKRPPPSKQAGEKVAEDRHEVTAAPGKDHHNAH